MAETSPVARSPIPPAPPETVVSGWAVSGRRSTASLTLTDHTPLTKVAVKASWDGAMAQTLDVRFGRAAHQSWDGAGSNSEVLVIGSGPGEWLALAASGQQAPILDRLEKSAAGVTELVTVIDVTHGRALVRLTGERSRELLSGECGTDLSDEVCPDGSAWRCPVSGVATDVVRDDSEGVRSYLLHVERSSGQYLFDSLLDAGSELGVEVDGFTTL